MRTKSEVETGTPKVLATSKAIKRSFVQLRASGFRESYWREIIQYTLNYLDSSWLFLEALADLLKRSLKKQR